MLFSLLLVALIGASWAQLPGDVELLNTDSYNGFTYHVYGQATWYMALEICALNKMRLVKIYNQNKGDEVTYFIDKMTAITGSYWTLASRVYDDATWAFATNDPVKYFNWAAGEPNNQGGNERCVEVYKNGQWNDKDCSAQRYVLCEKAIQLQA